MIHIEPSVDHRLLAQLNKIAQDWHCEHYPDDFKPFDQVAVEAAFQQLLAIPNAFALVAKIDGQAIGYLFGMVKERKESAFQYEKRWLNIDQIAVLQAYQNRGVAQQLLECAEQLAEAEGISCLQLDHWAQNAVASGFFTNNGFGYFNHRMEKHLGD